MHHPTDRIAHTTAFVIPVVEHWLEHQMVTTNQFNITTCSFLIQNHFIYKEVNQKMLAMSGGGGGGITN